MEIINLTPHAVTFRDAEGNDFVFPPSGIVARVSEKEENAFILEAEGVNLPLVRKTRGNVEFSDTSFQLDGWKCYIVSALVLESAKGLEKEVFIAPNTGASALRNEKGHIVAVTSFVTAE